MSESRFEVARGWRESGRGVTANGSRLSFWGVEKWDEIVVMVYNFVNILKTLNTLK
jgi:hypothetical protein